MVTQELLNYINQKLKNGVDKQIIKQTLYQVVGKKIG